MQNTTMKIILFEAFFSCFNDQLHDGSINKWYFLCSIHQDISFQLTSQKLIYISKFQGLLKGLLLLFLGLYKYLMFVSAHLFIYFQKE